MRKLSAVFLLLALLWNASAFAQDNAYYTVQAGTFLDAKPEDFNAIRSIGFVHATKLEGNLYNVYVGGFEDRASAQVVADQIKTKGYTNAYVKERFPNEGQTVTVIQIATRTTKKKIEWDRFLKAGRLYVILNNDKVKVVTGLYPNINTAKQELKKVKKAGFEDAFIKNVNSAFLHKITEFETGIKKPLIPLSFDAKTKKRPDSGRLRVPSSYDDADLTARGQLGARSAEVKKVSPTAVSLPKIRTKVKRHSVLELQKVLKTEKTYSGKLDGYYGKNTARGYELAKQNNRELQKYLLLSQYAELADQNKDAAPLQRAINNLPDDPSAAGVIEGSKLPVAKAYQSYLLFNTLGPTSEVNYLMNSAIKEAYAGARIENQPPFDYNATYAYNDLGQLILHLHYIHSAPANQYAAPCWLYERHPEETARAYEALARFSSENFPIQSCGQFLSWEEIKITQTIAADLNSDKTLNSRILARDASRRSNLFLAPTALSRIEQTEIESWNRKLWTGLNFWAAKDALHEKLVTALKVAYFQSEVRLEDFFMDKGFNADQARGLALLTLQALAGYHLERFI